MMFNFMRILAFAVGCSISCCVQAADSPTHPVVFVPGILGSKLCDESGNTLWGASARQSVVNYHRLDLSAPQPEKIKSCGLIEKTQVLGPLFSIEAYGNLIDQFRQWGLIENSNLFLFDYDWRQSNLDNAVALERFIRDKLGADAKFNIVAHSMGGIVSRLFLERPGAAARVNKIIYLGTPFLGSMNAMGTLAEKWGQQAIEALIGGAGVIRRVTLSFPGYLELLPRYQRCCSMKRSDGTYESIDVYDPEQWRRRGWLISPLDGGDGYARFASNLERAGSLSQVLTQTVKGVTEIKVAGDPKSTRFVFAVREGSEQPTSSNWHFSYEPGDGTVPLWSAARDPSLKTVAGSLQSFTEHATIFNDKWVLKELQRELFTAEAVIDRPIAGAGRPEVDAKIDGIRRQLPLRAVRIVPNATYVARGDTLEATVALQFGDQATGVPRGAYMPRVALRQDGVEHPIELQETTTAKDSGASTLTFVARAASAGLEEGVAEFAVSLPGIPNEPTLREYVVVLP